jgi:hypothetical protein
VFGGPDLIQFCMRIPAKPNSDSEGKPKGIQILGIDVIDVQRKIERLPFGIFWRTASCLTDLNPV